MSKRKEKLTLEQAIEKAKKCDGYLVLITRREGEKLYHNTFTFNFFRNDIFPSLEEFAKLLKPETE
ncbi:MAG: hypothetical protein ACTSR2_00495 [Candidatus Hodarchaeales archaeon]